MAASYFTDTGVSVSASWTELITHSTDDSHQMRALFFQVYNADTANRVAEFRIRAKPHASGEYAIIIPAEQLTEPGNGVVIARSEVGSYPPGVGPLERISFVIHLPVPINHVSIEARMAEGTAACDIYGQAVTDEEFPGAVPETLFDAHSMIAAVVDNTPLVLPVADNRFVGRYGGNIAALTAIQARALLNVEDGADVTDFTNVAAAGAVMEAVFSAYSIAIGTSLGGVDIAEIGENQICGRLAGEIEGLTSAEVWNILGGVIGVTPASGDLHRGCLWDYPQITSTYSLSTGNRIYAIPFSTLGGVYDSFEFYVSVQAVGKSVKCGIYNWGADNLPSSLLWDGSGSPVSIGTTGNKAVTGIAQTLAAGRYFLAVLNEGPTGKLSAYLLTYGQRQLPATDQITDSGTHVFTGRAYADGLPDPFGAVGHNAGASVPALALGV